MSFTPNREAERKCWLGTHGGLRGRRDRGRDQASLLQTFICALPGAIRHKVVCDGGVGHMRTVNDWTDEGYRGLRIPRCTSCRAMTWRTWDQLQAKGPEEVLVVAQRFHCGKCDRVPAGLPVVVGTNR